MKQITVEQLNVLLKYLGSRPYSEVFNLITILTQLPDVEKKNGRKEDTKQ